MPSLDRLPIVGQGEYCRQRLAPDVTKSGNRANSLLAEAVNAAFALGDAAKSAAALAKIGALAASAGYVGEADEIFCHAGVRAGKEADAAWRTWAHCKIALAHASCGREFVDQLATAEQSAAGMPMDDARVRVTLAMTRARLGICVQANLQEAQQRARTAEELTAVAIAWEELGFPGRADATARGITSPLDQTSCLCELAVRRRDAESGKLLAFAAERAQRLTAPWERLEAECLLATAEWMVAEAGQGRLDDVTAAAATLADEHDRSHVLCQASAALSQRGAFDLAQETIQSISLPRYADSARQSLATAHAGRGRVAEATTVADAIDDERFRHAATSAIALALARQAVAARD